MIIVVGLSHKTAPIEVRERLAIPATDAAAFLNALIGQSAIREAILLSTCNRVEVAAVSSPDDVDGAVATARIEQALRDKAGSEIGAQLDRCLVRTTGLDAVRHIFRVASSLDSLVVGEPQVLGQVKDAFDLASNAGSIGTVLGRTLEAALHVAKRVRSETQIGAGMTSIASVAVDLARQIFGDLRGHAVGLIGAGEMAEAAAKHLCGAGAVLRVCNRSRERAEAVALIFKGEARPWTEMQRTLLEADVIIASTASQAFVVTQDVVSSIVRARRGRSMFIIDIAVPRNVDPSVNTLDGVYLYDIDDLSNIAGESMRLRLAEAERAENIVAQETKSFGTWLDSLGVAPTIAALRRQVQDVLEREMDRSLNGKLRHLTAEDRKALEAMVSAAVNKLTHTPSTRLKAAAGNGQLKAYRDALEHLFGLSASSDLDSGEASPDPEEAP